MAGALGFILVVLLRFFFWLDSATRHALEVKLREPFAHVWRAHDPLHCSPQHLFESYADYSWRTYTLSAAALYSFGTRFGHHTVAQEASHLQQLSESCFHSKAKTKHLRHSLAVHLLEQAYRRSSPSEWTTEIPYRALKFGLALSDFMDMCDKKN